MSHSPRMIVSTGGTAISSCVPRWLIAAAILAIPLLAAFLWGRTLNPQAYRILHAAGQLRGGDLAALGGAWALQNPLAVLLLAPAPGGSGTAVLLSSLGWSATAAAVWSTLVALGARPSATLAALLVAGSPAVAGTAGTPASWVLALGWIALALTARPGGGRFRPALKALLLLLLLALHFDGAALLFALTVLVLDGWAGRSSWAPALLLVTAVFTALVLALWQGDWPVLSFAAPGWWANLPSLTRDWQLWWLFLPGGLLGAYAVMTTQPPRRTLLWQTLGPSALWAVAALLSGSTLAGPLIAVSVCVLNGLGLWTAVEWLRARGAVTSRGATLVAGLLFLPLMLAGLQMARQYGALDRQNLAAAEAEAADWLRANSTADAILLAAPQIAYLAERPALPFEVAALPPGDSGRLFTVVLDTPPDFIVSDRSLAWDSVTRSGWFQERYVPAHEVARGYSSATPLTVWRYQPSLFDAGTPQEVQADVAGQFEVTGYQVQPPVFAPGEDIAVTLYLRASAPPANGFITGVHLVAPDGRIWAWREEQTPRSLSRTWWEPGQVIAERYLIPTTTDLPSGAYSVEAFWRAADDDDRQLPVVQGNDDNVLDRVKLGYVMVPQAATVPDTFPVGARFGEQIVLDEAALGKAVPGEAVVVTLIWEALSPPDGDYTVFVHLLDEMGTLVTADDSKPEGGRFPTVAWRPGTPVIDRHELLLPADLAAGQYEVKVGLYQLESGERLPVKDARGAELTDRAMTLGRLAISRDGD